MAPDIRPVFDQETNREFSSLLRFCVHQILFETISMCHIQRVSNSCGHVNDHVLLACHIAKAVADTGDTFQPDVKSLAPKSIWDKISQTGFHASTQPYCKDGRIRCLPNPGGFKCMVDGCGRAD
ncbi:hypothetical protein ASPBRDRAFT_581789 [Aspergillus brasiliensis CBS 101740]|uniref:Uncharacterized protein n=1 Tax=Aspergillus brasiliensis (strain CBS 101740 / IMI 381727 / IBT 21946) TaxID=767769 RepID=A0A1L9UJP8_ASPBC|nr:hypothetical protein ASPBRDRAFT_581789 [Aspergillus brasiliensis CBS 101740]